MCFYYCCKIQDYNSTNPKKTQWLLTNVGKSPKVKNFNN